MASGGFVRAVESEAASVDEVKLMLADIVGDIAADTGDMLVLDLALSAAERRDEGVSPVAADVLSPSAFRPVAETVSLPSPVASPLNVLFPHS
jgi:hypothetical protein